jgi:putative DNA primase/helicase
MMSALKQTSNVEILNVAPRPSFIPHADYLIKDDGVYVEQGNAKGTSMVKITYKPVYPTALMRNKNGNGGWSIRVSYINLDGQECVCDIEYADMHNDRGSIASTLVEQGFPLVMGKIKDVFKFLADHVEKLERITTVEHLGWLDDRMAFLLPDGVICDQPLENNYAYLPKDKNSGEVFVKNGSLASWQEHVLMPVATLNFALFTMLIAFTSCLLKLLKLESGGFNLWGASSKGKTASLQAYASVWGNGGTTGSGAKDVFTKSWNATARGLETLPPSRSGTGMALDELGLADDRSFASSVYTIADGAGSLVMDQNRNAIQPTQWTIMFVSSSEISMREKIKSGGKAFKPGMAVRLIDVQLDGFDVIENDDISITPKTRVEQIKKGASQHYGHAGPMFIQKLTEQFVSVEEAYEALSTKHQEIADSYYNDDMSSEHYRIADRFALVTLAGTLAVDYGILTIEQGQVDNAVIDAINAWYDSDDTVDENTRVIEHIGAYITKNLLRFRAADDEDLEANQDNIGFKKDNMYLLSKEQLVKACDGISINIAKKALMEHGLLHTHGSEKDKRYTCRFHVEAFGRLTFYAIKDSIVTSE